MHQTCTGTKKTKLKFPGTMGPLLSSCCFFCFFGACRCLVHLVVCFFWCMSMFCEVRATKPAQAPKKKTNKPLDAPNLHRRQKKLKFPGLWVHFWVVAGMFCFLSFFGACRCLVHLVVWFFLFFLVPVNVLWSQSHQACTGTKKNKKQTTRCTKPAQAPKKLKFPGTMGPHLSSCWFFFFGACRCLVHLVVWFFWFFWCLSMFCEVRVTKPAQAPKKTKSSKPLDAPNLHRHQKKQKKLKFPGTMGPLLSSCWIFCFFVFFGACRCLVHLVVCFFCFFWCLSMFCEVIVTKPAQAPKKPKEPNH